MAPISVSVKWVTCSSQLLMMRFRSYEIFRGMIFLSTASRGSLTALLADGFRLLRNQARFLLRKEVMEACLVCCVVAEATVGSCWFGRVARARACWPRMA